MGGRSDLRKRLRVVEREREEARERSELIVSKIKEAKGMVRESR